MAGLANVSDVPKLEQLIVSRLRAALQDRLVHPHHLSLALPRLLSPSVSQTPLINDIGEGAVDAMSDALRKGVSQMMDDFLPNTSPLQATAPFPPYSNSDMVETHPSDSKTPRRIHMPAGFPGYTPLDGNTPMTTPQLRREDTRDSLRTGRSQPQAGLSSARVPQIPSSAAGSSQFRFRGQFAGQNGVTQAGGEEQVYEQRRVGVLNARN